MSENNIVAPQPEVQHLTTIFRRMRSGDIRIPAFQRQFVWKGRQILELLDSVYRGYPISSLLFWRVREVRLQSQNRRNFPHIADSQQSPINFVLDGMQRLSTLYGVFNFDPEQFDNEFRVSFDLLERKFEPIRDNELSEAQIALADLFNPRQFLETQRRFLSFSNSEQLLDEAVRLHAVFQEYMLPIVTIESEDLSDVVTIFERVNSTGSTLGTVDFMRAVTWSEGFDLESSIEELDESLGRPEFEFDDEVIVKLLAATLNTDPTADAMLALRRRAATELRQGMDVVREKLRSVADFLRESFGIESSDFIPYAGQVVILAQILSTSVAESAKRIEFAKHWFLVSSLDELLGGRPDNFIARLIRRRADGLLNVEATQIPLSLSPEVLQRRRLLAQSALSVGFTLLFALRNARSLKSGRIIERHHYLKGFTPSAFESILNISVPGRIGAQRSLANLLLEPESLEPARELILTASDRLGEEAQGVLESQFITGEAVNHLRREDIEAFIEDRAAAIADFAHTITSEMST